MAQRSLLRSSQYLEQSRARLRSRFAQKFSATSTLAHGLQMQSSTKPKQTLCHLEAARQRLSNRYLAKWPAIGEHHAQSDAVIKPVQTTFTTAEERSATQSNDEIFDFVMHHGDASTHSPTSSRSTLLAIMGQGYRSTSSTNTLLAIMAQGDRMLWRTRAASTL